MKLDKKMEFYLREAHIDFTSFRVLEVVPQNEEHAVVLLVPKNTTPTKYFCTQYRNRILYFGSTENMMVACVESNYLSQRMADKLVKEYYAAMKEGN